MTVTLKARAQLANRNENFTIALENCKKSARKYFTQKKPILLHPLTINVHLK